MPDISIKQVAHNELLPVIAIMKQKISRDASQQAQLSMLCDFESPKANCTYFYAEKGDEGSKVYGLMSLSDPPKILPTEKNQQPKLRISESLWVEGLITERGSKLGIPLLDYASDFACKAGKDFLSLAAYEDDMAPNPATPLFTNKLHSTADYYQNAGFEYTGEGYVENDGSSQKTYPIYAKTTLSKKL